MFDGELCLNLFQRALVDRHARFREHGRVENLLRRRLRSETVRRSAREQPRDEVGAIARQLEQRLVHQLQLQVASTDVHDERDRRLHGRDVSKILLGADADVRTAARHVADQIRDDVLETQFVRQQVLGTEAASRFRKFGDKRPEFLVRQVRRDGARRNGRRPQADGRGHRRDEHHDAGASGSQHGA